LSFGLQRGGSCCAASFHIESCKIKWSNTHMNRSRALSKLEPTSTKRTFRLQFSLRTFLILVAVIGIGLGWLGMIAREAERQQKVVGELEKLAGIEFSEPSIWVPALFDTGYLDRIKGLDISTTEVSDVSALGELKNLERLVLYDTQVSDVSALGELKNLEVLVISGTQVSDVSPLKELKNLQRLDADRTQVSDVSALGELKNLKALNLHSTPLRDVSALEKLKNLEVLVISGTQVSDEDVAKLKRINKRCFIYR
jgi:Leucine-rich repeat (LRR) protein